MDLPPHFWLITYHELVWNRELLAFVPASTFTGNNFVEQMQKLWFTSEADAAAQLQELHSLQVLQAQVHMYNLKKKLPPP